MAALLGVVLVGCPEIEVEPGKCVEGSAERSCPLVSEGAECREAVCLGDKTCGVRVIDGFCFDLESGSCLAEGASSPTDACLVCAPSTTQNALVAKTCASGEQCQAGSCVPVDQDADIAGDTLADATPDVVPDDGPTDTVLDEGPDVPPDTVVDTLIDVGAETDAMADIESDVPSDADASLDADPLDVPDGDLSDSDADNLDAVTETDQGTEPSGYRVYPAGFSALGPSPPASNSYRLRDQRFLHTSHCSNGFCVQGGFTP